MSHRSAEALELGRRSSVQRRDVRVPHECAAVVRPMAPVPPGGSRPPLRHRLVDTKFSTKSESVLMRAGWQRMDPPAHCRPEPSQQLAAAQAR